MITEVTLGFISTTLSFMKYDVQYTGKQCNDNKMV
jgi:hypothetical protein